MKNFQLIVLSIWELTDKIYHFYDCTINEESILSNSIFMIVPLMKKAF